MNKLIFKKSKAYTSLSPFIWITCLFASINPFVVKYNTYRKYTECKYIVHCLSHSEHTCDRPGPKIESSHHPRSSHHNHFQSLLLA